MEHVKKGKPYWIERSSDGRKLFCFKVRRHGQTLTFKYTLKELKEIMGEA